MYPDKFDYYRPDTVDEALEVLNEHPQAEILAGGHSLIPAMKTGLASPDTLIDIGGINELRGIDHQERNIDIGALTRYVALCESDLLWEGSTLLAEAAEEVGDVQVRNRGTIGGNLAHADPASDLPGAVLAANGTIITQGLDGEREIPADKFFQGMYMTDVHEDEILTGVRIPNQSEDIVSAYIKRPNPSSGYAMVGIAALLQIKDDTIQSARIAVNGVMDHPVRLSPTEDALKNVAINESRGITNAADQAGDELSTALMMEDVHASSEFRENLLRIYTDRAITAAVMRFKDSE